MAKQSKVVIAPQKGKQELAMNVEADVIFYGGSAGSGKSHLLLMRPLRYVNDPNFEGVFFRKNTTQLSGPGGLWPESKRMYAPFNTRQREKQLQHIFKAGSTLNFSYLDLERHKNDHQGLQYSFIGFDELTHFSSTQFTYLLSRLRSGANMDSFCMGTCNPDPDSWVLEWVQWYLDDSGYPREDRCGQLRYFVVVDDKPQFRSTVEELKEEYAHLLYHDDPVTGERHEVQPMSFCFINGTIFDNPALIRKEPAYLAKLKSLPEVERARLLEGNWYIRAQGSNYFDRKNLIKIDNVPLGVRKVRAWDKASQEPSQINRDPDYTAASPLMSKCKDGYYYLEGGYDPAITDPESELYGKFRKRPGERDTLISKQAKRDGEDVAVILSTDPGSAGKSEFQEAAKRLLQEGFIVKEDPMPVNKSKLVKFTPFASAVENGLVRIVESTWPNKKSLEAFYKELEAFSGERSTRIRKDDWPDSVSSAFNYLAKERVLPDFSLPTKNSPTLSKVVRDEVRNVMSTN